MPLRDIVVFPHMVVPLFVGRDKSVRALEEVMKGDKQILLVTQKNSALPILLATQKNRRSGRRKTSTMSA
jgi:ATP-dependent Lon protease